ncbi:MAG: response regulator [Phycisphaerales bacterium]
MHDMANATQTRSDQLPATGTAVLVIEDDRDLAALLVFNLQRAGYQALAVHDGRTGLDRARQISPDLILLDVMLPELSGTEVAGRLRSDPATAAIPIIMLTAKGEEADQLSGLRAGADDYITKPFSMRVLLARSQAILRRMQPAMSDASILEMAGVALNLKTHEAMVDGRAASLTLTEFRILSALLGARGTVLSRAQLMSKAMGPGVLVTDRTIDVHVTAIRRKLGPHASIIRTVRGVGYRVAPDTEPAEA